MFSGKRTTTKKAKRLLRKKKLLKRHLVAEGEAAATAEDQMEISRLTHVVSELELRADEQ